MAPPFRTVSEMRADARMIQATIDAERRRAHRQLQQRAARNLMSRPGITVPRAGYTTVPRTRGVYAQGEMKYFDTELPSTAIAASTDWTGTEYDPTTTNEGTPVANPLTLCVPKVGSAINQRIGREIKLHKLKIRGSIIVPAQQNQTAPDGGHIIRVILAQDMQTNSTQMQGEQLMQAPVTANATQAVLEFQSLANFGRFRVLKDKMFKVENPNISYDGTNMEQQGLIFHFKWTVNFREPVKIRFNATNGGTFSDIVDNSFHILANSNGTALAPTLTYNCRACYKE